MSANIIIADDHSMIRTGIKLLLTNRLGYKNIQEADSCSSLMTELKKGGITHIVLDVIFSDGTSLEVVPTIRRLYPDINIMIFSMQLGEVYADAYRQYGIYYYLNKSSGEEEIVSYLKQFLNNVEPMIQVRQATGNNPFSLLAPRELEILHYLINGYSTKQIGETLNLSPSTVSTLKKRIFDKTGADNMAKLFELASLHNMGFNISNPHSEK